MTHFIRQQFLNVTLNGSEDEGLALQRHLSDIYYSKLLPLIEKVLDNHSSSNKILMIDQLEIDAGTIELDRIDQDLPFVVIQALIEQLEKSADTRFIEKIAESNDYSDSRETEENLWEVFIYFLQNGYLPWWYILPESNTLEEVLAEYIINESRNEISRIPVSKISNALSIEPAAKRMILQFSEKFIRLFIEKTAPDIFKEMIRLLHLSENMPVLPEESKLVRSLILEKSVLHVARGGIDNTREEIARTVLEELRSKTGLFFKASEALEHTWLEIRPHQPEPIPDAGAEDQDIKKEEIEKGIYINNAGLVLLHPFLPRFFETLGIIDGDEIKQPDRALNLLNYLTTGDTKTPEYELVLPKILCQIPLPTPVEANTGITENEMSEASALLNAVISHWAALRNTSQDELRSTFLLRPGKLSQKDDSDWLLQVESRTYDILLDQLPWSISMIKLPWMKRVLWVEWGT